MGTALIAMGALDIAFIVIGVVDDAARSEHYDVERQFKRPGNEGDLL